MFIFPMPVSNVRSASGGQSSQYHNKRKTGTYQGRYKVHPYADIFFYYYFYFLVYLGLCDRINPECCSQVNLPKNLPMNTCTTL